MNINQYSSLFRLVLKFFKYFLLALFGFCITYILSVGLGVSQMITTIIPLLLTWFLQLGIILLSLLGIAVVLESLR